MLLVASVVFLAGFWTGIFPTTHVCRLHAAEHGRPAGDHAAGASGHHHQASRDFGAQWRTVIIAAVACIAISAAVFFLGQLIVDRGFALVGAPILSGGVVATLTMQDMANKANLPDLAVFATLDHVRPGLRGLPRGLPCASRARPSASRRRSTPVNCR